MYLLTGINRPRQNWEISLDGNQIKQIGHPVFPAEFVLQFISVNPKSHLVDGERPQIPTGKGLYQSLQRLSVTFLLCSSTLAQTPVNFCPRWWVSINVSFPSCKKPLCILLAFLLVYWPLCPEEWEVWPLDCCCPTACTCFVPVGEWCLRNGWFCNPCPDEGSCWKLSLWSYVKPLVLALYHLPICILHWVHLELSRSMNGPCPPWCSSPSQQSCTKQRAQLSHLDDR